MKSLLIVVLLIATAAAEYLVIDVSEHNGDINWAAVKSSGVQGAIIRCGYGSDIASQDDKKYSRNINGAINNGVPFGIYIYSYATNTAQARSEAAHVRRLVDPYKSKLSLPVYYDLEQSGTENYAVQNGKAFIADMESHGYTVGVYANEYWFRSILGSNFNGHSLWVAKYGSNNGNKQNPPNVSGYDIWQYTSVGRVNGIYGNVDMNACYRSIPNIPGGGGDGHDKRIDGKSNFQVAREVLNGVYGNGDARRAALGSRYDEVQSMVNLLLQVPNKSVDELAREVIAGVYGNGDDRKYALGDRYDEVQKRVNEIA